MTARRAAAPAPSPTPRRGRGPGEGSGLAIPAFPCIFRASLTRHGLAGPILRRKRRGNENRIPQEPPSGAACRTRG
jgi:hypothetical protein